MEKRYRFYTDVWPSEQKRLNDLYMRNKYQHALDEMKKTRAELEQEERKKTHRLLSLMWEAMK